MPFPERLSALRKDRGLTQQVLADRVGVHVTLMRRYEAGKTLPSIEVLRRIALALNVSADVLLFEDHERGPDDDLRLEFEATKRLDPAEKETVRNVIHSVVVQHDVKRFGVHAAAPEGQ